MKPNSATSLFAASFLVVFAIFTEGNIDDSNSTITLASGMTLDELNREKGKTIEKVASKKKK